MRDTTSATPTEYLAGLPADRRKALAEVRRVVKKHLPKGYQEGMTYGGITWSVPLRIYPGTYNGQPLCYVALANQKHYASLHVMIAYGSSAQLTRLKEGFRKAGKKLDMGKSCIRFKTADDLALDVIGEVIASTPMGRYIEIAELARSRPASKRKKSG